MWTSTAASGFGDRMIMLAALALLGALAASADATATNAETQFWFFLPYLIVSGAGGFLADRLPRKWLMLGCDEARGLLLGGAALALWSASGPSGAYVDDRWKVRGALFAVGVFAAVFNPVRNAVIPQLVPRRHLQPANAIILVINIIASQVGLILGGRLITETDISSVRGGLLIGAVFYLVSGTFYAFLKPAPGETLSAVPAEDDDDAPAGGRGMGQAVRYTLSHRRVLVLIAMGVLVWSVAATVTSGLYGLLKRHHGMSGDEMLQWYTYLSATMGVGMLVGAAVIIGLRTRIESDLVLATAYLGAGVSILLLSVVPVLGVKFVAAFGVGLFGNIAIVSLLTVLQGVTPNYIRGRIMGLNAQVTTVFSVLTYLVIWQLDDADRQVIIGMIVLGVLLAAVAAWIAARVLTRGCFDSKLLNVFHRLVRLFAYSAHGLRTVGKHHLPSDGPVLLVANHTTGIDPFVLQGPVRRLIRWVMLQSYRFGWFEFMWRRMRPIFLNDAKGSQTAQLRDMLAVLKEGGVVGFFPEGGLQRDHRELQPFQPGLGLLAKRSGAPIVVVWISGTPVAHSILRHFVTPSRTVVTFAPPWSPDPGMKPAEIVERVRERMEALASQASDEGRVPSDEGRVPSDE